MSDNPSKCKIDLTEKSLTCGYVVFDPCKHCILCGKGATKKNKLTSSDNGMEKIREVGNFSSSNNYILMLI